MIFLRFEFQTPHVRLGEFGELEELEGLGRLSKLGELATKLS